jgi:hypothetical protein
MITFTVQRITIYTGDYPRSFTGGEFDRLFSLFYSDRTYGFPQGRDL